MTISNTLTADQVQQQLDQLEKNRLNWEQGAYKKSNSALAVILQGCFDLLRQTEGNIQLRKQITNALKSKNITFNEGTSMETRVVRFVFGDCGNRVFIYARVLKAALAKKSEKDSMETWLAEQGGVDNVASTKSNGGATRDKLIELAEAHFDETPAIVDLDEVLDQLAPSSAATNSYSLALLRTTSDGKQGIVYGTSNQTLVKSVLAKAAKEANLHQNTVAENADAKQAKAQSQAIDDALDAPSESEV
ncbi:hypothetical protein [Falsiphaeobacter marinintestinus]|uniref:hypothetical protein n=1 Tax=Falsiphaeobacter marinintestinus TaxID=1492905 RepID=UPI0011B46F09|nr:hypothetical protein [Phaeobacter marinintestinus]